MIFERTLSESTVVGKMPNGGDIWKVNTDEAKALLVTETRIKGMVLRPGEGWGMSGLPRIYVWGVGEHTAGMAELIKKKAAGFNIEDVSFTFYAYDKKAGGKNIIDLATPSNNLNWWLGKDFEGMHDLATEWYRAEVVEEVKNVFPWAEWLFFSNAIVDLTNGNVAKEQNASSEWIAKGLIKELKGLRK
jgi:hypothetical protein